MYLQRGLLGFLSLLFDLPFPFVVRVVHFRFPAADFFLVPEFFGELDHKPCNRAFPPLGLSPVPPLFPSFCSAYGAGRRSLHGLVVAAQPMFFSFFFFASFFPKIGRVLSGFLALVRRSPVLFMSFWLDCWFFLCVPHFSPFIVGSAPPLFFLVVFFAAVGA